MDQFDVKKLTATARAGGRAREEQYGEWWAAQGVKLRRKYRRPQMSQFGTGADITGKAHRNKLSAKAKALLPNQPESVRVILANGKAQIRRTGRWIPAGKNYTEAA